MYPVGLLFGFGKSIQVDQFSMAEDGPRVRYCIISCNSSDIRNSETRARWQEYQTCPHSDSPRERSSTFFFFFLRPLIPASQLLFTAGMTLIDSLDSILMLYSYTGFPEHKFALFVKPGEPGSLNSPGESPVAGREPELDGDRPEKIDMRVKMNAMSGLSIILTLISILVAFRFVLSRVIDYHWLGFIPSSVYL